MTRENRCKIFVRAGVEFEVLTPEHTKEYSNKMMFKLRELRIEPNEIKKYDYTFRVYKEFCKDYVICHLCGKIIRKQDSLTLSKMNFCGASECVEKFEELKREISQKISKSWSSKLREDILKAIAKTKQTKLKKYGDENYINNEKAKQTKLKKYGDENYNNREKSGQTLIENFGSIKEAYKFQNEKAQLTKLKKYGDPFYHNVKKMCETNLKKYGEVGYNNREKCKQTNLSRYGIEWFVNVEKRIETINSAGKKDHYSKISLKSRETNLKKYGVSNPSQSHIKNYELYNNPSKWVEFCSPKEAADFFGICFSQALSKLKEYNPNIIKKRSKTQSLLFESIKSSSKLENTKTVIPPQELDIYLPDIKLAIEYNGLMFHSQGVSDFEPFNTPDFNPKYHLNKTLECKSRGIQLFHIFEGEDLDLWLSMIHGKLGINTRVYGRKCSVRIIDSKDTRAFLNENHIQGYVPAKICLGLYENTTSGERLVSVMTFSKPRFSKKYEYEMIRFCSLKHHNVVGGASKLWKFFLEKYNPKSVVSYANLRFSNGGLYEKLGFSQVGQSAPNYFYFKDSKLENRNKYQKHRIKELYDAGVLSYFNPSETEVQNMFKNGFRRIFDAGIITYEFS